MLHQILSRCMRILFAFFVLMPWNVIALAQDDGDKQVTICHVAGRADDPANHIQLTLNKNALRGHFDESGTPLAGHENDYFGSCNPPSSTVAPEPNQPQVGASASVDENPGEPASEPNQPQVGASASVDENPDEAASEPNHPEGAHGLFSVGEMEEENEAPEPEPEEAVDIPPSYPIRPFSGRLSIFDPSINKDGYLPEGSNGRLGDELVWVITVTNDTGIDIPDNTTVVDSIRPEQKILGVSVDAGGSYTISGQTVTVTVPPLKAGEAFNFTVTTEVIESSLSGYTNTATISETAESDTATILPTNEEPLAEEGPIGPLAVTLTVDPLTWNMIGLDSNKVTDGPDTFMVGARACNTGTDDATNVTANLFWDSANPYINLSGANSLSIDTLAAGECFDFYFNVKITRDANAYDTTRDYHIEITDGSSTVSTPLGYELYVERLVSQNRNSIDSITGETVVYVGETHTYTMIGSTATNGYEQVEAFLNFPNILFRLTDVETTYKTDPGVLFDTVYVDACGWINDPTSPDYMSCSGTGKTGGDTTSIYTVDILSAGTATLTTIIYDFSGSSFHYNSDFGVTPNIIEVRSVEPLGVAKAAATPVYNGDGTYTITYTIQLYNASTQPLSNVQVTDDLAATFGAVPFTVDSVTSSDFTVNFPNGYDGSTDTNLLAGTDTLPAQTGGSITLEVTITPGSSTGPFTNTAEGCGDTILDGVRVCDTSQDGSNTDPDGDQDPENNNDPTPVTIPTFPDLAITKDDGGVTVAPGDTISYTLNYENIGTADATGVEITETVPTNTAFNAGASSAGWSCSPDNTAGSTCTYSVGALASGTSGSVTFAVTVDSGLSSATTISNTASIADDGSNGTDPTSDNNTATDITPVTIPTADLAITKTDTGYDPVVLGENVQYTLTVTNNGPDTATGVTVADTLPGSVTFVSATPSDGSTCSQAAGVVTCDSLSDLANGASVTVTVVITPTAAGTLSNSASVSADTDDPTPGNDTDTENTRVINPDLTLTKSADLTSIELGTTVTFSIDVENTGNVTLTNFSVSDDTCSPLSLDSIDNEQGDSGAFEPGEIWHYTCSMALSVDTTNTASASGDDELGNTYTSTDTEAVDVWTNPVVTKTASPTSVNEPGGTATFTIVIENPNTGDSMTINSLTDDVHGDLNGQGNCSVPQTIAPGGSYTCSFTATVSGEGNTSETDTVTASGTDEDGVPVSGSDSAAVDIVDVAPGIIVNKSASPTSVEEPGGSVTFTVRVDNTSTIESVTLDSLSDDQFGDLNGKGTCATGGTIAAGGFYECSFTATVSGDATASPHANTVTAQASDNEGTTATDTDNAVVTILDVSPTIAVSKTASPASVVSGNEVDFTVVVTNTSPESVTLDSLNDSVYNDITQVQGDITTTTCATGSTIAAGGTYTCTFTAPVSGSAGSTHTNTVTAQASDDDGNTVSNTDSANVVIEPLEIAVSKTASLGTLPEPGGEVTFTVTVENLNSLLVTLTNLSDSVYGDITQIQGDVTATTCATGGTIAAGGTYTCIFTVKVSGDAGSTHTNTVSATATDGTNTATASDSALVAVTDVLPTIAVDKSAGAASVNEPKGSVTFTVLVTNTSPEDVTLDSLNDSVYSDIIQVQGDVTATTCATGGTIAANGGTYTCTFTATVSGDAGAVHINTVTAQASDNEGNTAENSDDATVTVADVLPSLTTTKTATPTTVPESGADVSFAITVQNDSDEPVTLISLIDNIYGDLDGQGTCSVPQTLDASGGTNDSYSCSFTKFVSGTVGTDEIDTITATVRDNENNEVSDNDGATVSITDSPASIAVTKTAGVASVDEPGGSVTFTIEVENTSAADSVTLNTLDDDIYNDITSTGHDGITATTCKLTSPTVTLDPSGGANDTYTCTFTATVEGNASDTHTNTVTASGTDDDGGAVSDTASATVTINDLPSSIAVTKTAGVASVDEPGGSVTFTIEVENTSAADSVTLNTLDDDIYNDITSTGHDGITATTCKLTSPTVTLDPSGGANDTYTCTFTATVEGNAGDSHTNTVTASGTDDDGGAVSDTDNATVTIADVLPTITTSKSPSPSTVPETGGSVTFTVEVQNTSPESLTLTNLNDTVYGNLNNTGTCAVPQTLDVSGSANASYSCTFTATVSGTVSTSHTNTVTATAEDDDGNSVDEDGSAQVDFSDVLPEIAVTKSADPLSVAEPGGNVTFTIRVDNTSDEPVELITLDDSIYGNLDNRGTCQTPQNLLGNGSYTCTFTVNVSGSAGDSHTNIVTATAKDDEGNSVSETDSATVTINDLPSSIAVTKTASVASVVAPGGAVVFTIEVKNTSTFDEVTLSRLDDDIYGDITQVQGDVAATTCSLPETLAAGESYTCTFTAPVSGSGGTAHVNTVTVEGFDDDEKTVSGSASATVAITTSTAPVVILSQLAAGASPNPEVPQAPESPAPEPPIPVFPSSLPSLGTDGPVCGYRCTATMVYHSDRSGDWEILHLDTDVNLSQGAGAQDMAPSISPDGQWIAFASNRDGNWELYIGSSDGTMQQRVTYNTIAIDTDPVWGPGNAIIYESTRDGNWELYMVDTLTGIETRLTHNEAQDVNAFWSPDGTRVAFQSDRDGMWQIYELNLLTGETRRLSDGLGNDMDPQYSFDGQKIVFRSYREGDASVLYLMDAQGGEAQPISDPAGNASNHVWSSDNQMLAYQSDLDGDLDIYVYEFSTGLTRQLTDNDDAADHSPTWRCGTKEVIFTSDVYGNADIFEVNALPMDAPSIHVEDEAIQHTDDPSNDIYPQNFPSEENASREGRLPGFDGAAAQANHLKPDVSVTQIDASLPDRPNWMPVDVCTVAELK